MALKATFNINPSGEGTGLNFDDAGKAEKAARIVQRAALRAWRKLNGKDKKDKPEGSFMPINIEAQPVDEDGDPRGEAFVLSTVE